MRVFKESIETLTSKQFNSGKTLRSHLTEVKDSIPITTESSTVYSIPCSCGKVYIGEKTRRHEQRVKEHQDA